MANVLVVDDHADSCKALMKIVSLFNGPAECVQSGREAIEYMRKYRPKLVFLDWMMPEMGGQSVLLAVRADPELQSMPVIVFSAASEPAVKQAAFAAGAQDFIVKGHFDEIQLALKKYVH